MRRAGVVVAKRAVVEKTTATTVRRRCAAFVFGGGGGGDDCFLRSMSRLEGALNVGRENDDDDDDDGVLSYRCRTFASERPVLERQSRWGFMNVGRGVVGEDEVAELPDTRRPESTSCSWPCRKRK